LRNKKSTDFDQNETDQSHEFTSDIRLNASDNRKLPIYIVNQQGGGGESLGEMCEAYNAHSIYCQHF